MHREALDWLTRRLLSLQPRRVLELGSRDVNGSPRERVQRHVERWHGIDLAPGPGVDEVADAADYARERAPFVPDVVVCAEVLEHAPRAAEIVARARELLRPGAWGVFLVTAAAPGRAPHSAVDGGPLRAGEFYRNVSREDVDEWFRPFRSVIASFNSERGDVYVEASV